MTDDTRPTFAEVHARRGYTVGVFFPPEAPWEVVEAAMDRIFEVAGSTQGPEGGGWDAFAVGLAGDQLGIEADLPDGTHIYMSTSCLHGDHEHCKSMVGVNGDKRPGRCKFCDAVCRCPVCKHDVPVHSHVTDDPDRRRDTMTPTVRSILAESVRIWGDHAGTAQNHSVLLSVTAGDIARQARSASEGKPVDLAELGKEYGNLIVSAIRWCREVGLDPDECVEAALAAQEAYVNRLASISKPE